MQIFTFLAFITSVTASCNILALSGGGAFGAVEVGILDSLTSSKQIPNNYDVVTGISAGALNAGFLSYFDNVSSAIPQMIDIFSNLTTNDVYTTDYLGIFTRWSIYDNSPLEQTLTKILQSIIQSKNPPITLIGASNIITEVLDIFKFNNLSLVDKINVLMSTSAIPLAFPPRKYNNELYVDGGVISNEIINQAIGEIQCNFYNITFISASTRNPGTIKVTGLISYISAVFHLLFRTFDYQLAQVTTCPYPKGQITACFPTSPDLENYSILDFNNGYILYELGKQSNKCIQYQLC
jgi:predicted patatin/cPLA2 family phospholipase